MKKLLLINTPLYTSMKNILIPLGICYLAAAMDKSGYRCDMLDGHLEKLSIEEIVNRSIAYDIVGLSSNSYTFRTAVQIAYGIKAKKDICIILGGYHATFEHEKIVNEYTCFDAIVRGEGETPIVALYEDFNTNQQFTYPVEGVTYKNMNGKTYISNVINLEKDIESLANPDRRDQSRYLYDEMEDGSKRVYVSISSSRGCPYNCSFCAVTKFRKKWVARSSENVSDEIYALYKKHPNMFVIFVDDNFYIDPVRAKDIICKMNEKCRTTIPFSFCTRADQIIRNGNEYLQFFRENGCHNIEIGIENGSNNSLRRYCKNTTADENRFAIRMTRNANIYPAIDYILFEPETTIDDLKDNIKFMKSAKLWGYFTPLTYYRIRPQPGTDYYYKFKQVLEKEYGREYHDSDIDALLDYVYFIDKNVQTIYDYMQKFRYAYQMRISDIVSSIDQMINIRKILLPKNDYLWLRMLPYRLLEQLTYCSDTYQSTFETFIETNEVSSRLNNLEKLYM